MKVMASRTGRFGRTALVAACCIWCAGCAGLYGANAPAPAFRDAGMSVQDASAAVGVGSSKADVEARLGRSAAVAHFDSGFEVWVYRERSPEAEAGRKAELVLLFSPAGTVAKLRVRPAQDARVQ